MSTVITGEEEDEEEDEEDGVELNDDEDNDDDDDDDFDDFDADESLRRELEGSIDGDDDNNLLDMEEDFVLSDDDLNGSLSSLSSNMTIPSNCK